MKKINIKINLMLLLIGASISISAQINRTLDTKVADILAQLPVNNLNHSDQLMQEIIDLKSGGILNFCDMIVPLGTGDDTKARYAIESVAIYSGGLNQVVENSLVENVLLKSIQNATNDEVKTFFIDRLAHCGTNASVSVLSEYLTNDNLYNPALAALTFIGTPEATKAIFNKTKTADDSKKPALIIALGNLRYTAAINLLRELSVSNSVIIREKSLAALAEIASVNTSEKLIAAAKKANYELDNTKAIIALIQYGKRLKEVGHIPLSNEIAYLLLKNCKQENQLHFRSAGIHLLRSNEVKGFNKVLIKEVKNSNKSYRVSVLEAASIGQTTAEVDQWIKVYKKASSTLKSEIISMLQEREETVVFDKVILSALKDDNVKVRIAGIKALPYKNKDIALSVALQTLKITESKDELEALKGSLLRICDFEDTNSLAAHFDEMNDGGKEVLVVVLSARNATAHFDEIVSLLDSDSKQLQKASYLALASISTSKNLSKLLSILKETEDERYIAFVQKAIIGVLDQSEIDNSNVILDAFKKSHKKEKTLPFLSVLSSESALELVTKSLKSGTDKEKNTALTTLLNWRNNDAILPLFDVVKTAENDAIRVKAFDYYLSQIGKSDYPDAQKLLLIQKLMPVTTSINAQKKIVRSARGIKTFLSLIFVSNYLEVEGLTETASNTAIRIALPTPGKKNGLSGKLVREIVSKSVNNLTGPDSQYTKIDVREFLANMSKEEGFVSIFNGKDFTGWEGLVKNPVARQKMSKKELAKAQELANEQMMKDWFVKDGVFGFKGAGYNNICTIKDYGDFEMLVDWKITNGGDSGIYLRGTPQVQIWDIARVKDGAQVGSGGLYNNQTNERIPLVVADNPTNEWNNFRIKMVGERVTVHLNGVLVTDNVALENYWDRKSPIFDREAIELQAHGEDLGFRNIYVREISSGDVLLTKEEKSEGFKSLFNGKDLDHWIGNKTDYIVENNEIAVRPLNGGHGNLYTAEEYSDFNFRFEFKLTPGANNGLGIHAPLEGDVAYEGKELQILDNTASIYANLKPYQYHGSVYGILAAKRGFLNAVGEWNTEEVIVRGDHIKILLNGTVIVDGNIKEATKNGPLDGKKHPGLKRSRGHIAFLGHGAPLEFRNIRIKDLSK